MPYKAGDKVVAARSLGMLRGIQPGTRGVIRSVSFLGSYTVDFGDGRVLHEVKRDELTRAPLDGPLSGVGGGCMVMCLAVAVVAGTALRRGRAR